MLSKEMIKLGTARSVIREIAAYGAQRAQIVGPENVLDFSLGNPSVPAPKEVQEAIKDIVDSKEPKEYHGYTASNGAPGTRKAIADNLNKRYGTNYTGDNVFMTCGAAASFNIVMKSIIANPGDEVIVMAPYFPEYKPWIEAHGGKMVLIPAPEDFQIDLAGVEAAITNKTRGIIVNTPNNPSGVVYTKENLVKLSEILDKKSKEIGEPIYMVTDEPYRELVYTDAEVPHMPNLYKDTIVCYSWSKSLSLPGERIGYVLVPTECADFEELYPAIGGAARILGYVCAPHLFQQVVERCIDVEPDLDAYIKNRDLLYNGLVEMGYNVAKPEGAFYMFVQAPNKDATEFCKLLQKEDVLCVPGDGFGCSDYLRISYCVDTEKVEKALPAFKKAMEACK